MSPINEGVGECALHTCNSSPGGPGVERLLFPLDRGGNRGSATSSDLLSPTASRQGSSVNWGLSLSPPQALWVSVGDLGLPQFRKPLCHKDHFPGALRFRHARPGQEGQRGGLRQGRVTVWPWRGSQDSSRARLASSFILADGKLAFEEVDESGRT